MDNLVVLRLGRQQYGLPVGSVTGIIQMIAVTEVPQLPPGMLGMINYRGEVIPLLDLRQLCETPVQNVRLNSLIVIANTSIGKLGLLVDGVHGVQQHDLSEQHEEAFHPIVHSMIRTDEAVILMVNLERLAALVRPFMTLMA
jgi:purine-binding chemotaxis protein CheW